MEATELRIGNWYNSIRFNTPIKLHLEDFAEASKHADGADSLEWFDTHIDPIPLTEQWLRDFGFKLAYEAIHDAMAVYKLNNFGIVNEAGIITLDSMDADFEIEIEYVHTLQNLYSSLTGKELIKTIDK